MGLSCDRCPSQVTEWRRMQFRLNAKDIIICFISTIIRIKDPARHGLRKTRTRQASMQGPLVPRFVARSLKRESFISNTE